MNIFKLEIKKNLKGAIIWGTILSGILFLYMAFFPTMKDLGFNDLMMEKIKLLPKGLLDSLGLSDMPNFSVFMEYYCYVFQFLGIGLTIYGMILGTKALCKEEGDKTIEYLYSKPVSRSNIVLNKMLASFIMILIVTLSILFTSIISSFIFNHGKNIDMISIVTGFALIPVFVYWAIGFVLSSFLRDDSKSIVLSLAIFFGTYLIGVIALTVNKLSNLKHLSPINYNSATEVFKCFDGRAGHSINIIGIIISIIIVIIGVVITLIHYKKKDLYC